MLAASCAMCIPSGVNHGVQHIGACRGTFDPVAGSIVASCYRINCSNDTGFQHEKVGSLKSALPKTLQEVMEVIWKRDWW